MQIWQFWNGQKLKEKFVDESEYNDSLNVQNSNKKPHIITTSIEHVAVLESCRQLEKEGFVVTYLPVDEKGQVRAEDVASALRPETILISVMLANNEVGTILPVRPISVELDKYKKQQGRILTNYPYLHTDSSQAPNYIDINLDRLGADMMTLDGSKIYGPKGIGCLIKKSFVPIENILYGGGHEDSLRPGTENVPNIIGFSEALSIASEEREEELYRMSELQKYFIEKLKQEIPNAELNGDLKKRLPNNINICIKGLNAEFAVIQLDEAGVACAAATACKNLLNDFGSYVVEELNPECAKSSLRFTMGRGTMKRDIDFTVDKLRGVLGLQRK